MKRAKSPVTKFVCSYKDKEGLLLICNKYLEFVSDEKLLARLPTNTIAYMEYSISPDITELNITFEHNHKKKTFVFSFDHNKYSSEYEDQTLKNNNSIPIDEAFKNAVYNSLNPDTANKPSAQISADNVILAYSILKYLQRKMASNIHSLLLDPENKRREYCFFKLLLEEFCLKNQLIPEDILMDKFDWIKWLLSLDYTSIDDSKTLKVDISELLNNNNKKNFVFDVARNKERFRKYKFLEETKQIKNVTEFKSKENIANLNDVKEKDKNKIYDYLQNKSKDEILDYLLNKCFVLPSRNIEIENINENIDFDAINRLHIIRHDLISSKKEISKDNCDGDVKIEKKEIKWNNVEESYNYNIEETIEIKDYDIKDCKINKEINKKDTKSTFYIEKLIELGKFWMNN